VAAISGLSNAYIRHLENGNISNVHRGKLIAFGLALDLNLTEIDQILNTFDRSKLTTDDIPYFLETGGHRKVSKALLPLHDLYSYELQIMMIERIPGQLIITNDRPTAAIMAEGFRTYVDRKLIDNHTIYRDLIEAVGKKRKENFLHMIGEYHLDHYMCKKCLQDYVVNCADTVEKSWRIKHVEQLISYVKQLDNFNLYLSETCSKFNFSLKIPDPELEMTEKLVFMGKSPHSEQLDGFDRLSGFATENQSVISNFMEGLEGIKKGVISKLETPTHLIDYLEGLIKK
jgi:hypothetical protein